MWCSDAVSAPKMLQKAGTHRQQAAACAPPVDPHPGRRKAVQLFSWAASHLPHMPAVPPTSALVMVTSNSGAVSISQTSASWPASASRAGSRMPAAASSCGYRAVEITGNISEAL
jgi:hypothetical protein